LARPSASAARAPSCTVEAPNLSRLTLGHPTGYRPWRYSRWVVAKIPSRRFTFVGAPGWSGNSIVTPRRCYGGTKRIVIDPESGAHLASYAKGSGSLKRWQGTVGRLAKKSTGLRLSIAAALAAPLLRSLSMDSFALNLTSLRYRRRNACGSCCCQGRLIECPKAREVLICYMLDNETPGFGFATKAADGHAPRGESTA
jgi:uncharacterized protein DUF927